MPKWLGTCAHARTQAEGITGKRGKPIDEGYLYQLLNNPIYVGEAVHKGMYPGKHKAIVSRVLWNKVRKILSGVTPGRAAKNAIIDARLQDAEIGNLLGSPRTAVDAAQEPAK